MPDVPAGEARQEDNHRFDDIVARSSGQHGEGRHYTCRHWKLGQKQSDLMVWGMHEPGSFGDFFPDGEYVSWKEEVKRYFDEEMSSAERAEFSNNHVHYRRSISRRFDRPGDLIEPHGQHKHLKTVKTYTNLSSLIITQNGLLALDDQLKQIIEKMEPDTHQFWPIKITMPKGREYPRPYFGLQIRQFNDSFDPEMSDRECWRDVSFVSYKGEEVWAYEVSRPNKRLHAGLAMRREVFGNSHLWREVKLRRPHFFLSDDLHAEIVRQGLRVPKTYQLKEV